METRIFNIPSENKSLVETQIEKLNRRANKLSLPTITLTWGKAFLESRTVKGNTKDVLVIPVEVNGPLNVSYDGYKFLATLQHLKTGENIIRSIDNDWIVPVEYHNSGSQCEHCQVNRFRNDTYLVIREADGKTFQVGSSCITDFLGGNSTNDVLKKATLISELVHFMNGACSGGGSNNDELFHITNFLSHTVAVIRHHGWVSKSVASSSGEVATVARVMSNIDEAPSGKMPCPITPEDTAKAKLAAEWAESLLDEDCDQDDYLHNIRAISRSGMVGLRTTGFAASIIAVYNRELAKHQPKQISSHVGVVKMREEFDLTVKDIYNGHSNWGGYTRYTFQDDRGNILTWTSSIEQGLEVDKKYRIRGTVKNHSEFKGMKQTELNRCTVEMYHE